MKINLSYRFTKISLFLLLFCSLSIMTAQAQQIKVTIKNGNITLGQLLGEIEKQTDYLFVYSNEINLGSKVSIDAQSTPVNEILKTYFESKGIYYTMEGNNIVLSNKTNASSTRPQSTTPQVPNMRKGEVLDKNGEPLVGASVIVKGSNVAAITDIDGKFSIQAPDNSTLLISYIGFEAQSVSVSNNSIVNVILKEDTELLEEVVVVGFGTQKKVNLTGAVSAVQMEKVLGDRPVTSLGNILQGSIPGLTASSSPSPGSGNSFNIRGANSITGGSPLILVDNVVYNDLYLLNPDDIESVSVLKDASSAAIYGARASFGVILITTKKAKKNEPLAIHYNDNFGFSSASNLPKLASPIDFFTTLKEGGYTSLWSGQNIETEMALLQEYNANPSKYPLGWTEVNGTKYFMKENNLYKEMLQTSFMQSHNVSAQGGSEKIKYRLSLGYSNEDGVLITNKDSFERTSVAAFVSGDITKWLTTSLDISYNNGLRTYPYVDGSSELGIWKANLQSCHPVGYLPYGTDGDEYPVMTPANIIQLSQSDRRVTDNTRILSRTTLSPFTGFKAILEYSYQLGLTDYESYANFYRVHQGLAESIKPSSSTTPFTTWRSTTKYTTINAYGTYDKTFADAHNLSVVAGYNQEYSDYRYLYSQAYNMISNELPSLSGTDGETPAKTNDSYDQYALRSGFFRAAYNYKQRYFLEVDGRYDLSSKFPKAFRGGFFPSVSGAWNIANESFMEPLKKTISMFKLKASYGTLGNQAVANYGYLATMGVSPANWISGGIIPKTLGTPPMVRATYTWEKVENLNIGLDFGFFDNRLTGTVEVYRRNTIGMLGPSEQFPAVAGASAPQQNAADMKTNGWELTLGWRDSRGDFNYGINFNIYDSRSVITKYKNETKSLSASYYEGEVLGEIWGFVTDGFYTADDFETNGQLKEGVVRINGVNSHEGDIKFKNLRDDDNSINVIDNGDNTVNNPGDRKIIGNSNARLQFGANGYFGWKGFNFSFILQGVGKRDAWIGGPITFPMPDQYNTVYEHQVGRICTPDNIANAYYGRIYENGGSSQSSNQRVSDKFLYNAAYLRIKNLTLSYNFPKNIASKLYLTNLKVFVSGENLFTFDHLPIGIDPENLGWGYPHYKTVSFGINLSL